MKTITLHIKNMVCPRCIMVVRKELQQLGAKVLHIELGYAEINASSSSRIHLIEEKLNDVGFELIHDKESVLIEEIKVKIIEYLTYLQYKKFAEPLSVYLSRELGKNYGYLSSHFSRIESRTIEKYVVAQKIERVKELLDYDELTLGEIASYLGYSSVHYLSAQFKKVTGVSVTDFRKSKVPKRKNLDAL